MVGDAAIAKGETRYTGGDVYSNRSELAFDADGRCVRFVEWSVLHPRNGDGAGEEVPPPAAGPGALASRG